MADSFPCLVCGKPLRREFDEYEAQPREGVMCSTNGNDGSTVYDAALYGMSLHFNICDPCLVKAGEQGRLYERRDVLPVVSHVPTGPETTMRAVVGYEVFPAESVTYIKWNQGLPPDGRDEVYYSKEELQEQVKNGRARVASRNERVVLNTHPDTH